MNYKVLTVPNFDKQAKQLAKKYSSLRKDLEEFEKDLRKNPTLGDHLGNQFYKVRMAIASKGKGKSGGARIITYVKIVSSCVYLAAIYDKSDKSTLTDKELQKVFNSIPLD